MRLIGPQAIQGKVGTTALADSAVTLAKLNPTGSDGQVLTSTGGSTAPAYEVVSSGVSRSDGRHMMLQIADLQGQALNFPNGFADPFDSDTIGSTSTNETYDASNDYYHNPSTQTLTPAASDWTQRGSGATLSSGSVATTSSGSAYSASNLLTGDFVFQFQMSSVVSDHMVIGVFDGAADEVAHAVSDGEYQQAGMNAMDDSFFFSAGPPWIKKGSSTVDTSTWANTSNTFQIRRISNTISIYNLSTTTQVYAWSGSYSADMRAAVGGGGSTTASSIIFTYTITPPNMTLIPAAATAASAPSTGYLAIQADPVDSITLNTDLKGEISRDNGSNWTQVTLSAGATNGDFTIYGGSVDISGQPSGTQMKYRVTTLNNKEIRISGVVLRWA